MLITNALAIVWLLNKQVGATHFGAVELLSRNLERRYGSTQRVTATCRDFYLSYLSVTL